MNSKKGTKRSASIRKGLYIALFSLVAVMGMSAVISRSFQSQVPGKSSFDADGWQVAIDELEETDPPVVIEVTPKPKVVYEPEIYYDDQSEEVTDEAVPAAADYGIVQLALPVVGGIIRDYLPDELVWSPTFEDWRTHEGVDIEASVGTQVKAAAAGVVERVYEDEFYGITVIIRHSDNLQTLYGGLQSLTFISENVEVEAGDIIGGVGESTIFESADPPHIHFEVLEDGIPQNPYDYLIG